MLLKCCTQYTSKVGRISTVHKGLFFIPIPKNNSAKECSPTEMLLLNDKMPGFLDSGGEEINLGPEMRLDHSELLCNQVLLKYKGDGESF